MAGPQPCGKLSRGNEEQKQNVNLGRLPDSYSAQPSAGRLHRVDHSFDEEGLEQISSSYPLEVFSFSSSLFLLSASLDQLLGFSPEIVPSFFLPSSLIAAWEVP